MRNNNIYYIGYFDTEESKYKHVISPAGSLKMRYIAETLSACDYYVRILSLARPICEKIKFVKSEDVAVSPGIRAFFFSFICVNNFYLRKLSSIFQMFLFFVSVLIKLRKTDTLIVYHSLSYASLIFLLKKCIGFKLVLEVEEIYQDVKSVFLINSFFERLLFNSADAYIFPSELIEEKVNIKGLPYVIIYGSYKSIPAMNRKMADSRVHVVYSGTFDERKGGVFAAIRSADFLNETYHIHITGFGKKNEIEKVVKEIDRVSNRSKCRITYDGFINNIDFLPYLQQFNIGLCTQNPDDQLSSSCFPSKILQYMANGLTVLASRAPAVIRSRIAPDLFFYREQTAESIAQQIRLIPSDVDTRKIVDKLDSTCKSEMKMLMNAVVNLR